MNAPAVSLIVTTYTQDRLQNVAHLLESVRKQTRRDIEVVFVAEGSSRLCEQVRSLAPFLDPSRFKVVLNSRTAGLSGARNTAVMHAQGRIVAFVDDDVVLSADWAERLVEAFARDDRVIGLTGSALPQWEDPQMAWLPEEFYWLISCTGWFEGGPGTRLRNAWGMNMAFRREAFAHTQFDEAFGGNKGARDGSKLGLLGEDTVFSLRVREATRGEIVYDPDVRVFHTVSRYRLTSRYVRRRAFWEGYTKAVLRGETAFSKYGNGEPERRLLRRIFLKFLPQTLGRLFLSPKWSAHRLTFATSTLFYTALGYVAGRFTLLGGLLRPLFER